MKRKKQSPTVSIYPLRYDMDTGNASEDVKFISSFAIIAQATCLLFDR